ncbi:MMPL family transporter [Cupriavidus gilardii]|uniref:MMPL family transporter n=1 Tax=Cupriavidus gilardii TaxID=82541 RepID=UPI000A746811|nr:MMPL family transporter [Cupriavidus gilardii]
MTDVAIAVRGTPGPTRMARALALVWLLLAIGLVVHQMQFWREARLDTDVLALLPVTERTAIADRALRQLADNAEREVMVLVGAPDWPRARAAAQRFAAAAAAAPGGALLQPSARMGAFDLDAALDFYRPYRAGMLTDAQRAMLTRADTEALAGQSLARLYQFAAGPRLADWQADPLNLWPDWWLARGGATAVRQRDGLATVSGDGAEWVVLGYHAARAAFAADGASDYRALLAAGERAAQQGDGDVKVVAAGIPLHAEAAAVQANREMNVIGLGSLAAVLLLVWLAFRSLRPIGLVALSLVIGTAAALSVTALVFGRVHLITLVFGASLVGVAEDYGIHYFVMRQARPAWTPARTVRMLFGGMALALATSVAAYLALGVAPFPGLRQMALFSATGLVCAFLTVVLWFPWLDRAPVRPTPLSRWLAGSLARWPRVRADRRTALALGLLGVFIALGVSRVRVSDDVRQLQSSPPELVEAQRVAARLLGTASPAQFIVVRGATPEQVLQREEAVKRALAPVVSAGQLRGVLALSDWVPSAARQQADAALAGRVEHDVRARVRRALGESAAAGPAVAASGAVLTLPAWLADPVSLPLRQLWLGQIGPDHASVMMLQGLDGRDAIGAVAAAVAPVAGALWVDRVADYSALLARYRAMMAWLLVAGAAVVAVLLAWRHGRAAWRALVPTLLAAALSVAMLGWLDVPLQLFSVLALALLLGVGVDYGIFLLEHPGDGVSWTAIVLGAASTLLAFGLLALSATPALHAFGMTMLGGVGAVWILSPWFRPAPTDQNVAR